MSPKVRGLEFRGLPFWRVNLHGVISPAGLESTAWSQAANRLRPVRLDTIIQHLGQALSGRPAAGFARRLMIPVSNDTLLRMVRRRDKPSLIPLRVPWALMIVRGGEIFDTVPSVSDLERLRTIALLPDRASETKQASLAGQPQMDIVARDRGSGYALATTGAHPHAAPVADRWHLMPNFRSEWENIVAEQRDRGVFPI